MSEIACVRLDVQQMLRMKVMGEDLLLGQSTFPVEVAEHLSTCDSCKNLLHELEDTALLSRVQFRFQKLQTSIALKSTTARQTNCHRYYFLPPDEHYGNGMTIVTDLEGKLVVAEEGMQPAFDKPFTNFSFRVLEGRIT